MDYEIREFETLEALETMKAYYLYFASKSCRRLAGFLQNGLENCSVTQRECELLCNRFARSAFFSNLIDAFLDYFCECGNPDNSQTEQALRNLVEYIYQEMNDKDDCHGEWEETL